MVLGESWCQPGTGEVWYCKGRPKPTFRGQLHLLAGLTAPLWGGYQLCLCNGNAHAIAASIISTVSAACMLSFSGLYHTVSHPLRREMLFSVLDYIGIFFQVAYSAAPWYVLLLPPAAGWGLIACLGVTVALGVWISLSDLDLSRHTMVAIYVAQAALQFPPLVTHYLSPLSISEQITNEEKWLAIASMACYLVGSQIYSRCYPDPWPNSFGFHEIWHLFVVVASACLYIANNSVISRVVGQ